MNITLTREEAQQVLDALEAALSDDQPYIVSCKQTIETIRARLSAPEPEKKRYEEESCPVCGYYCLGKGGVYCIDKPKLCGINTAPPQREWRGLTDKDREWCDEHSYGNTSGAKQKAYGRAIEAKLKEKNT